MTDFSAFFGGIERNSSGHIEAARTNQMFWRIRVPDDVEVVDNQGSGLKFDMANKTSLDWEEQFIYTALNSSQAGLKLFVNAGKSLGDKSAGAIFFEAWLRADG